MNTDCAGQVAIMMAVYNGAAFLEEQILSIIHQTYSDWTLYISDDHSTDSTGVIIEKYASLYPGRIILMENTAENRGAKGNFDNVFCAAADYGYYMFSDQDDIWLPGKIQTLMNKMLLLESKHGAETPLLIYSDLEIVDNNAKTKAPSFITSSGLSLPGQNILQQFLLYNCIPGCSMLFNASLKNLVHHIPGEAYMHDWWVALTAACFGEIHLENTPLIRYRQHDANSVGTIEKQSNLQRAFKFPGRKGIRTAVQNNAGMKTMRKEQAAKFLEIHKGKMSADQRVLIEKYINLLGSRKISGALWALRHGFLFMNRLYTIKFFVL